MGRVEAGAGRGGGQGPQESVSRWGLGGPGESESGEKTRSVDPSLFGRASALGLLERLGPWGVCLCGFGGLRVRPSLRRGLKGLRRGGLDLLLPESLERLVFGEWKLEAGRGGLGMLEAACVLVSGVRDDPGSGLGHGLSFGAGAMEPSWARGPGSGGRAGSRRFREIRGSPSPGPRPLYPPTLLGWAARVWARGGGRVGN